ncbi:Arylsulfatase [Rubripirellula amarantea]|uniref:Arylsulfatase n=1 Tax=Rubripirellula amarantea TaxID=2527999 RepID=A0A5C5WMS0_9BACT|nr:sulfatase-like hydrolase/transferase [Rubripirellula amarantea]TWT51092.1 Arylsulfatase [Rubripirellula amarantea]
MRLISNALAILAIVIASQAVILADSFSSGLPNVLLIVTDDQGYGDLSIHGNPHLSTPHIDELAKQSVRFDRFYVNSFCAPTRAALLTGRWPLRTGCHGVTHNREAMKTSEVTVAELLGEAGYRSACVGKWHNGEQFPYTPKGQGFDEAFGFNHGHVNNYFNAELFNGQTPQPSQGYISDVLTDEAMRFVATHSTSPFFCYLSYNAPHSPYQVPDSYFEKFKSLGFDDTLSSYYGMCENIDDNVGRLLHRIDELGLSNDTIVLFMTDNGGTAGVATYNAGMRGGKASVHEGGSRVPLFMRWPRANWRPRVATPIVSHIDILPTLLDLCGITPADELSLDGVSLRHLLEDRGDHSWPERTLFTHNPIDETNKFPGAVRTQQYRLVHSSRKHVGPSDAKANRAGKNGWLLFDMQRDPGETTNIADENPKVVEELSGRYDEWFADISRHGLQRFPLPIGHDEHNPVELHAPQAFFDQPIRFSNGPGYAHEWLTGWTDPKARIWFDVDVAAAGKYEVEIAYACDPDDAGSSVRISVDDKVLESKIPVGLAPQIPLPHRDEKGRSKYRDRDWCKLKVGTLELSKGPTTLWIEPVNLAETQLMDFKHVRLFRLDEP